jgi:hypothetical protein
VLCLWPTPAAGQDGFPDVCQKSPDQLLQNCDFSNGLSGWQPFTESGSVGSSTIDGGACHSPLCPAAFLAADGSFVGGLYQQVSAAPGTTYWANVTWLVYEPAGKLDNTVGRRVGIDPTGGTDPRSPAVVWGQDLWRTFESCQFKICPELQVSAVAQNSTITIFVRIESTWKDRRDEFSYVPAPFFDMEEQFWIDDVGVIPVGAAPPPTPEPATPTPAPAAPISPLPTPTPAPPTPAPVQASEVTTPTLEATEPPAQAQAPDQTATPTPAPPTPTPTPTLTATATATPAPTLTPVPPRPTRRPSPTPTPTPTPWFASPLGLVGGGVFCLGGAGVAVLLAIGGFLFWLYRLGTTVEGEDQGIMESGDQEIWESGNQEIGDLGNQEIDE